MTINRTRFLKFSFGASITAILVFIKGILFTKIFTNLLQLDKYGVLSMLLITMVTVSGITSLDLASGIMRYYAILDKDTDSRRIKDSLTSIIDILIIINSIVTLVFIAILWSINLFPSVYYYELITLTGIISFFMSINLLVFGISSAKQSGKHYALLRLGQEYFSFGLSLAMVLLYGVTLFHILLGLFLGYLISFVVSLIYFLKNIGFGKLNLTYAKELITYSLPFTVNSVLYFLLPSVLMYALFYYFGSNVVAIFSVAMSVANSFLLANMVISRSFLPAISRIYEKEGLIGVSSFLTNLIRYFLILVLPAIFLISSFSPLIIVLLSNSSFISNSVNITFLIFGYFFYISVNFAAPGLYLKFKTGYLAVSYVLSTIVTLTLIFILVPTFGLEGATFCFMADNLLFLIFSGFFSNRYLVVKRNIREVVTIFSISLVLMIPLFFQYNLLFLILSTLIAITIYVSILLLTKTLKPGEIKKILDLIWKK